MGRFYFLFLFLISAVGYSQDGELRGVVKDSKSGETIVGASISVGGGKGTVTDINGFFKIALSPGKHEVVVSFVGYTSQTKEVIIVAGETTKLDFALELPTLDEVEIVADVAKMRETPVAFSNITAQQIKEEAAGRDLPMLLNSTPGVYATEQGGGAGDARVTIRGFDQTNVAVMVDGVPVNDMENGRVFWSNWNGLGDITKTMQVQKGLGASKLAIASVGGTINIITKGIDSKMGGSLRQEVGNNGALKSSFGYTSGLLKNGFGITASGSYSRGDGWVDQTWTRAWSYFLKVQKRFDKHLVSLSVNGAPQKHGQRPFKTPIAVIDEKYAEGLGINADSVLKKTNNLYTTKHQSDDRGRRYNPGWGEYTTSDGKLTTLNTRSNYYHKPIFNLSDYWTINEKMFWSNVAYLSLGTGGGTTTWGGSIQTDTTTFQLKLQKTYDENIKIKSGDSKYSTTESKSTTIIEGQENNHVWGGLLSSLNYKISKTLDFIGGVDLRYYKGIHFAKVYDLLGGDYYVDNSNKSVSPTDYQGLMKRNGDKVGYYYLGYVKWGGLYGQLEYKKDKWSAFVNISVSETGYQRVDHFAKKDIVLSDTTFAHTVGWGDTLMYDGNSAFVYQSNSNVFTSGDSTFYVKSGDTTFVKNGKQYTLNSEEARTATTSQKWFLGYTIKTGVNYNLTEHQHVFANIGYLSLAPKFNAVFNSKNEEVIGAKNQIINSFELGYGVAYRKFAINLNGYYTSWSNKPYSTTVDDLTFNINGVKTLHKGVELDGIYKLLKTIEIEGLFSIGDWRYSSAEVVELYDLNGVLQDTLSYSAKGVHLGDAAQTQYGASVRYTPAKGFYVKTRITHFTNYYADFNPTVLRRSYTLSGSLISDNRDRDSWKMPEYTLVDLFAGYDFKWSKLYFSLTGGVTNLFDTIYLSDGLNGSGFNATSATVFFGMGRRVNFSLKIGF